MSSLLQNVTEIRDLVIDIKLPNANKEAELVIKTIGVLLSQAIDGETIRTLKEEIKALSK